MVLAGAVHFEAARGLILPTLFALLPLGYGLLTANMNIYGAHQFESEEEKTSWFSWYYFSINIGSILAFLIPGMIQQNYSFCAGLCLPLVVVVIGLMVFASARSRLLHPSAQEKPSDIEDLSTDREVTTDTTQVWRKVLPAMLLSIIFSICYCQMQTTWYVQAMWMDRSVFGIQVPVSYMMCADPLFVMLGIYVLENFVYPRLREADMMPSHVIRMAIGMGCSCLGMYSAYHVERLRLQDVTLHGNLEQPSHVSMLFQIPQFAFVAFAEIFVYTTLMEFAFSLAPSSMKSSINAVNIFMGCIANVVAGIMTTACSSWIPSSNPNHGHYDRFYLLLGAMCFATGMGFHLLREQKATIRMKATYGST
jgi:peptide/histidine transporter 3/4